MGAPGAPGALGAPGAAGAPGALGAPGAPGAAAPGAASGFIEERSAPHPEHFSGRGMPGIMGMIFPHEGHSFGPDTSAGLKHIMHLLSFGCCMGELRQVPPNVRCANVRNLEPRTSNARTSNARTLGALRVALECLTAFPFICFEQVRPMRSVRCEIAHRRAV